MRVLVVEDNARLADALVQGLARHGIAADTLTTVSAASYALSTEGYDLVVLDRGLPDGDGLALLRALRRKGNPIPCLMLTARDAIHDRVDGLDGGADDYLTKPFALEELVARLRALLRRAPEPRPLVWTIGDLAVDATRNEARVREVPVELSAGDLRLLLALAAGEGAVVRRDRLMAQAFGPFSDAGDGSLDVAIHRLRRRLRSAESTAHIVSVRGIGYALRPEADGGTSLPPAP